MRHHTLLHEVDLKIMERRRAKHESARMSDSAKSSVTTPQDSEVTSSQMQEVPNLTGPDQRLKWSTIKHQYSHVKDLDIADTDSGPV